MAETAGTVENLAPGYDSAKANVLASYANTQQVAQNVTENVANTANVLANQNMQTNVASTGVSIADAQAMNDRFSRLVRGVSAEMGIMAQSQELALAKTEAALNSYLTSLRAALPAVEARMQASLDAAMARFGGTGGGDEEEGNEELDVINESLGTNITEDDIDPNAGTGAFGTGDTEIINNFQLQAEGAINPDGMAGELYAGVDANLAQQADALLSAMMDPFTVDALGGAIKIESAVENIIQTIREDAELRGQPLTMGELAQLKQWGILATQAHYEYEGTGTPEMTADAIKAYGESELEELRADRPGVGGNRTLDEIAEASMLAQTSVVSERATAKQEADAAKEAEMRLSEAPTATTSYEVFGQHEDAKHASWSDAAEKTAEKKRLDGLINQLETKAENQPQRFSPQDNAQLQRLKNQRKFLDPYTQGGGDPSGSMDAYWKKFGKGPATLTWSDPQRDEKMADPINIDIAWQSQPDVVAAFAKSVTQQREREAQEARKNRTLVSEDPIATLASRMGELYKPAQAVSKKEEEKAWKDTFGWGLGFKGF